MPSCRYGCNRLYQTLEAMEAHRRASHPGAAAGPIVVRRRAVTACNDCGQFFVSNDALRQHQLSRADHVRPANAIGSFACERCNRTLRSQDALEQHFAADHSLIKLNDDDNVRLQLKAEFVINWRKPSPPGAVLSVFKVYNPGWRTLEFQRYKKLLPSLGNQVQRYHGTTLVCDLGINPRNSKLCQNGGCNLCNILRTGFKLTKVKTDRWQRFGKGIYTTSTSGKSNDYIQTSWSRRAVLVCRVLAGNVYRTVNNMPMLEAPPSGYDSVSGEVGQVLNYDETVVYTSKAILPDYIIVYTM